MSYYRFELFRSSRSPCKFQSDAIDPFHRKSRPLRSREPETGYTLDPFVEDATRFFGEEQQGRPDTRLHRRIKSAKP